MTWSFAMGRGAPVLQACSLEMRLGSASCSKGRQEAASPRWPRCSRGCGSRSPGCSSWVGWICQRLGPGWRQRVVAVPQFHDNHVFTGTLAFNLLMGRHWPPQPADLQAAEALCRALELGPLLDRMPAGVWQLVGETGWQLSHGERSRLYIARALLQVPPSSFWTKVLRPSIPRRCTACIQCPGPRPDPHGHRSP